MRVPIEVVIGCGLFRRHVRRRAHLADRLLRLGLGGDRDPRLSRVRCCRVGLSHDLGQAPVEQNHFAVCPQHHVFRLQIAMDHPARVGIRHRLTDLHKRLEQLPLKLEAIRGLAAPPAMEFGDRQPQGLPSQKTHRVERLIVLFSSCQLVYGHDVGMLELAGDLRFLQEPAPRFGIGLRRRLDLFECDVAIEIGIVGDPDLAEPPFRMQTRERVPQRIALRRRGHKRLHQHVAARGGNA